MAVIDDDAMEPGGCQRDIGASHRAEVERLVECIGRLVGDIAACVAGQRGRIRNDGRCQPTLRGAALPGDHAAGQRQFDLFIGQRFDDRDERLRIDVDICIRRLVERHVDIEFNQRVG